MEYGYDDSALVTASISSLTIFAQVFCTHSLDVYVCISKLQLLNFFFEITGEGS